MKATKLVEIARAGEEPAVVYLLDPPLEGGIQFVALVTHGNETRAFRCRVVGDIDVNQELAAAADPYDALRALGYEL